MESAEKDKKGAQKKDRENVSSPVKEAWAMLRMMVLVVFVAVSLSSEAPLVGAQETVLDFVSIMPLTGSRAFEGGVQEALIRKAVTFTNNRSEEFFPGSLVFRLNQISLDSGSEVKSALTAVSQVNAATFTVSSFESQIVEAIAPVLEQLNIIHYTFSPSDALSSTFRTVTQLIPSEGHQGTAMAEVVKRFGWDYTVAVMSSSSAYGSNLLSRFISRSSELSIEVLSAQQFYPGTEELWSVVQTTKSSLARAIVNFMDAEDMRTLIRFADRLDMLNDKYVWLCSDACAHQSIFVDAETGRVDYSLRSKFEGMIGLNYESGNGQMYEDFLDEWENEDTFQYAGAGRRQTSFYAPYAYDSILLFSEGFKRALGSAVVTGQLILSRQANVSFQGFTGWVQMDETGKNRRPVFNIVNLRRDSLSSGFYDFVTVGKWNETRSKTFREELYNSTGILPSQKNVPQEVLDYEVNHHVVMSVEFEFRDGSYNYPDLDVRNSYEYWSCEEKKMKTDETGKSVRLEKPDGQGADNIDKDYRCDQFIDCYNMSDEWGCSVSFPVLFIVYGIFLFLFICFAVACLLFTCIFGFCVKRKRVRAASPTFLIILCLAAIMGYGGLFAFFGQPHTVSCNFRIWFLAVAVITAISALFVKSFRVWRLYRSPTEIKALRDWQLILFVIISVLPVLILLALWTGLATPTAMLVEASSDNREHLLCSYGGVAEEIGFYFFFFAIVAYVAVFLLFGIFLSIATRNVVSTFNESRLIAISIYNITFSAIVTIPIVFVLRDTDPLITWIIIVTAFAYGFTATLVLQFVPKMWGIVVRDSFQKNSESGSNSELNHASVTSKDSKAIF